MLDRSFLFELHERMFGDVWRWAGRQRTRATNIGVEPALIAERTKQAIDDARYWHEHRTYSPDELAVRLHRQLVVVHPFPNGNGRCTRLLADLYLVANGEERFTWGVGGRLDENDDARTLYLAALRAADGGDHQPLLAFARS